jgi:cellulose biosynthesis protein BcsQ
MNAQKHGQIITFYSYKGGTGRSMTVANVAAYLARTHRVLVIDWDLEAPGLHYYFSEVNIRNVEIQKGGLLEFFEDNLNLGKAILPEAASLKPENYISETTIANLFFMKAGRFDSTFADRVRRFDWEGLHKRSPSTIPSFANDLMEEYEYILIDSRTGMSDTSAICTAIMPEKLVIVFTANSQNVEGAIGVARTAIEYRKQSNDIRPLMIFPLPSRVEMQERKLLEEWRFSMPTANAPGRGFQRAFESLVKSAYDQEADLSTYFDRAQIQHSAQYSYGEEIAVLQERRDRLSLATSYIDFAEIVKTLDTPWDLNSKVPPRAALTSSNEELYPVDIEWFQTQEMRAESGLQHALQETAYAEFCATLLTSRPNKDQRLLLDAARFSQIQAFGWPIGYVADSRADWAPRPTSDGILAEIPVQESPFGPSYDYWALRRNGDFFILYNYFEEFLQKGAIAFDTRIMRIVEGLLYCSRLYKRLEVPDNARIRFMAKFTGLRNRQLIAADKRRFFTSRGSIEDFVRSEVTVSLNAVPLDLVGITKALLDPLFVLFDFTKISDSVYSQVIQSFLTNVRREGANRFREGFTVDLDRLRLFAESIKEGRWISKVYDLNEHLTIYETETSDERSAKLQATSAALLTLYGPKHEQEPEQFAGTLAWREYTLPTA